MYGNKDPMRYPKIFFCAALCAAALAPAALNAYAAITPALSLQNTGNGYIALTVTGDPGAPVELYDYSQYPYLPQDIGTIGKRCPE
jgi:hypothetical protein